MALISRTSFIFFIMTTISTPLQAFVFGNFGTLFVPFSVVKATKLQPLAKNTLATLQFNFAACLVDVADEGLSMPDYRSVFDIPETNTAEKITAILWENILEWELGGAVLSKAQISIVKHYLSAYADVKKLQSEIIAASQNRQQSVVRTLQYRLTGTLGTTGIQKIFNDCEKDFYNLFA